MKVTIGILLIVLSFASGAVACQFDTDCAPGSKCLKAPGSLYGICAEGIFPGNDNDRVPVRHWNPLKAKVGNTCQFDTDCDIGGRCMKSRGSIYGV